MKQAVPVPVLSASLFRPGMRIAVACSGGADSVALLRALLDHRAEFGLALSVAHMNHGIRGAESDADAAFVEALASSLGLAFHWRRVETPAVAEAERRGLEEAARGLRYAWFWEILAEDRADAVVTAHTLDDQAETVLHRLIRGAWTEGLGGIFPVLEPDAEKSSKFPDRGPSAPLGGRRGAILRPWLSVTRREIEAYLRAIGQPWREDSTNRDAAYTRNRIRHQLLPALADYNPGIRSQLAHLAALARDEEAYWQGELARLLPSLLLPGKPTRGGGRATDTLRGDESLAIEVERLRPLPPAVRRRALRAAAARLGAALDFDETERLLALAGFASDACAGAASAGSKLHMEKGLRAERTARELRLFRVDPENLTTPVSPEKLSTKLSTQAEYALPIPGAVAAPAFGLRLEATVGRSSGAALPDARLRACRPGDRVVLRHSRSPLKVKEALHRARLPPHPGCPVLEWRGEIVWMPGLALQSAAAQDAALIVTSSPLP